MIKKIETKQIKTISTRENICVWYIESIDTLDVMLNKTIITQKIISGKVVTHEKSCYIPVAKSCYITVAKTLMKYEK